MVTTSIRRAVQRPATGTAAPLPPVEPCEHCHREIRWVTTAHDHQMKINADPDTERGNQRWLPREGHVVQLGAEAALAIRAEGVFRLYVFHGLDCPTTMRLSSSQSRPRTEQRPPSADPTTRAQLRTELAEQLGWPSWRPWKFRR